MTSPIDNRFQPSALRRAMYVVGIEQDDDYLALKKAYRTKLKKLHPDLNGGRHKPLGELIDAYELLEAFWQERQRRAAHEAQRELTEFISIYKVLIKKYCRRLSASKFQILNLENRAYILSHAAGLVKEYNRLTIYPEYLLARRFLEGLTRFHYLPLSRPVTSVAERRAYHIYRKVIRTTTWALEETFSSLNGVKNKTGLWRDYLTQIGGHLHDLSEMGLEDYGVRLVFMDNFLEDIAELAVLFGQHKAILPIGDYMRFGRMGGRSARGRL